MFGDVFDCTLNSNYSSVSSKAVTLYTNFTKGSKTSDDIHVLFRSVSNQIFHISPLNKIFLQLLNKLLIDLKLKVQPNNILQG